LEQMLGHRCVYQFESGPGSRPSLAFFAHSLFQANAAKPPNDGTEANPAHQSDVKRMPAQMESWRKRLKDLYPLSIENPEPKIPNYAPSRRVLDRWQPKWIRDKYFGGSDTPNHGKK
jgi:hypothetical protein